MPYLTSEYCIIFGAATQSRTFVHVLAAIFIPKFKGDDDMAKRKKHPRLPNGYGQIRFLGKNRRNPYGVYPPAKEEIRKRANEATESTKPAPILPA